MLSTFARPFHVCISRVPVSSYGSAAKLIGNFKANHCSLLVGNVRSLTRQKTATTMGRVKRGKILKETLMAPATDTPFVVGKLGLGVASGVGLGALCFYGLGLSNQVGAIEKAALWPQHVQKRVQATYGYVAGSLGLTALAAVGVARTPALLNLVMRNGWMSLIVTFGAMIGTGSLCRSISYEENNRLAKHLTWMLHTGVMGAIIAPLTLLGGPLMMQAALYTAGVVGGLSTVAYCAPSEKFLNIGGLLGCGLGLVLVSSIATWFVPVTTAAGAGLYSVAMYGGLVLFSGFILYDTQRVIKLAETYPTWAVKPYDPVNACLGLYLDTLNIFIRIAMILAGRGNRRK